MRNDVRSMVENCETCNKYKIKQQKETLLPDVLPTRPWEKVGMDLFQWNSKNILIISDYFSNYFEMNQLNNISCNEVIGYSKAHFARYGRLSQILLYQIKVRNLHHRNLKSSALNGSLNKGYRHHIITKPMEKLRIQLKQRRDFSSDVKILEMNGIWRY